MTTLTKLSKDALGKRYSPYGTQDNRENVTDKKKYSYSVHLLAVSWKGSGVHLSEF